MASSNIKINGVAASNNDLPINTLVQLDNQNTGGELTFLWAIIDQPSGPADVLSSTIIQNPTFTPQKEGTYLIELIVNQSLPSEVRNRKIAAVRQLKTRERVPAADETIEDGSRGWAGAAGAFLQKVDNASSDPVIVVGQTGAAALTVGNIVRCTGVATIKAGLPGQENVPSFTIANATTLTNVDEPLGIIIGAVDGTGGPYAAGVLVRVRIIGLFEGASGAGAVVGNPVYVSDLGTLALTVGTVTRQVGTVARAFALTFDTWFSGGSTAEIVLATTAPANVTKAAAATGVGTTAARSDHKHDVSTAAPVANTATNGANTEGAATTLARSDHGHKVDILNQTITRPGSSSVTNTGTAFTQLDGGFPFELAIAAAGTYLVVLTLTFYNDTNGGLTYYRLQSGGTFGTSAIIGNALTQNRKSSANQETSITMHAILVAGGATNLYVGVALGAVGQISTTFDRTLTAVRLA